MRAVLRRRGFALVWAAGLISLVGDRALMAALPFYVYAHTGSTVAAAALFVAIYLPLVLLGSVAGVFVDWWDRRRLMVVISLIQAAVLLPLALMQSETWIWLVGFVETSAAMFFQPAERALLPRLVETDQLVPANALMGLNDNIARLAGPPIGGALLAVAGLGSVAAIDSVSFLLAGALIALATISFPSGVHPAGPGAVTPSWGRAWRDWRDGLRLVWRDRLIAGLFVVLGLTSLGGTIVDPLYAAFVRSILHGGPTALGWLSTASAAGGILAGLIVGRVGHAFSPWQLTGAGTVATGVMMLALYHQTALPPALALAAVLGLPVVAAGVGSATLLQTGVPDDYRGRIYGAFNTTNGLVSLMSVGLAGVGGQIVGIVPMLSVAGGITIAAGVLALLILPRSAPRCAPGSDHATVAPGA